MPTPTELRLQSRTDRMELVRKTHESFLAERGEDNLSDTDKQQIQLYREEQSNLLAEINELLEDKERQDKADEVSRQIRRAGLDAMGGDPDGPIYRTFPEYARDLLITGQNAGSKGLASKLAQQVDRSDVEAAFARLELLKRTPADTLSSNVGGLQPPQHIAQIFQVINTSRPLVASGIQADLVRGTLTFPKVTTRPVVAAQSSEKTEAGNTGMVVDMITNTATVYLGGGDLSWQAVNWSTPNALDLWFRLAAADYALKTEQDAGTVVKHSGWAYKISSGAFTSGSGTFAQLMTAIGAGYATVYSNSGRTANTVYMDPTAYGYLLGLTSNAFTQFTTVGGDNVGPLNIVISRGLDAGEIVVGDREGLICAETPGAPVDLQVVEPAIGGYEVGIIGGFEADVVDPGAFSTVSAAS